MAWYVVFGWAGIYFVSLFVVPIRKLGRGYITTLLKKIIPPKSWWRYAGIYRYWLFSTPLLILFYATHLSYSLFVPLLYGPQIIMLLDDYLNGDDEDKKRRWEGVKNKIKWLMQLPPKPTEVRDVA